MIRLRATHAFAPLISSRKVPPQWRHELMLIPSSRTSTVFIDFSAVVPINSTMTPGRLRVRRMSCLNCSISSLTRGRNVWNGESNKNRIKGKIKFSIISLLSILLRSFIDITSEHYIFHSDFEFRPSTFPPATTTIGNLPRNTEYTSAAAGRKSWKCSKIKETRRKKHWFGQNIKWLFWSTEWNRRRRWWNWLWQRPWK